MAAPGAPGNAFPHREDTVLYEQDTFKTRLQGRFARIDVTTDPATNERRLVAAAVASRGDGSDEDDREVVFEVELRPDVAGYTVLTQGVVVSAEAAPVVTFGAVMTLYAGLIPMTLIILVAPIPYCCGACQRCRGKGGKRDEHETRPAA